jgi:hypothetical protein
MNLIKKIFSILSKVFFIRLFLFQIAVIITLKIFGVSYISDGMTLGAMGFITALIGIYKVTKDVRKD